VGEEVEFFGDVGVVGAVVVVVGSFALLFDGGMAEGAGCAESCSTTASRSAASVGGFASSSGSSAPIDLAACSTTFRPASSVLASGGSLCFHASCSGYLYAERIFCFYLDLRSSSSSPSSTSSLHPSSAHFRRGRNILS